jgi:RHS repeat-associated protein
MKMISKIPVATLLWAGFLVAGPASVQATSMQTYFTANNYVAVGGGAISGTADVATASCNSADTTWEAHESAPCSWCVSITGTGSHPIGAADIPGFGSGSCFTNITWPTDAGGHSPQSQGFSINCTNSTLGYDKTGTMTISSDCSPSTTGYQTANVTIYNNASVVNVALVQGGTNFGNFETVRETTTQSIALRFLRATNDTYNTRTINYTVSGTAVSGSDYSAAFGGSGNYTATITNGYNYVDVPITILNNATLLTSNNLVVTLDSGNYQTGTYTNVSLSFLSNFPIIGVYANTTEITRGTKGGIIFSGYNPYTPPYPAYYPAVTVTYALSGTATNGADYTPALSGTITIPSGTNQITTNILGVVQTNILSGTKILTVTVVSNSYFIDPNNPSTTVGIVPNAPILDVATVSQWASPNDAYIGEFSVTRSGFLSNSFTANLTYGGTATSGVDYTALPASVQFTTNQATTNLYVYAINSGMTAAKTVVLALGAGGGYFPGLTTNAVVTLLPNSSTSNSVTSVTGRYWRGTGADPTYWSMVIPLDDETGTVYSNLNGNCSSLYPGQASWSSQTLYHLDATNALPQNVVADRIQFNNPIVAFGERVGGTPLYYGQPYSIGVYAGDLVPSNQPIVIQAFYRTNYQLAGAINIYPPTSANTNGWVNFLTNGLQFTTNAYGLTTTLASSPVLNYGQDSAGAYVLNHTASTLSSNYYYVVEVGGSPGDSTNPMVLNASAQIAPSLLYSLEFEARPAWRAVFLDQPQFNGSPLPPFYAGMTLAEMLTNTPPVTNAVSVSPTQALSLDDSPELRRHPILDNFVASMNNDPIALANYVINQIGLTDPIDYNDDGSVSEDSINPGGVTRGALGTFVEKQGSPIEQCALLVYLLRQAGVPAVYEFAPHNGLQMLDARLSDILKFQVHGVINPAGQVYTTNTMIPVNYPWVAAYIGTNWVHIFPWMKDYQITEGLNLWEEMPTNYSSAYSFMYDYIYGKTNLLSLAQDGDDTLRVILPKYLKQTLLQNHPGISADDIGVQIFNRQHYYARWQDFPTPTLLTNVSTAITNLSSAVVTSINPALTNVFDTMSVEIYSATDPTKDIQTGDMRLCDLHNRQFYIYQSLTNSNVRLSLILMPFRTNVTTQLAFTNDTSLLSKEVLSLNFDAYDYQLGVRFKYHRNRAITPSYAIDPNIAFFRENGFNEIDIERPLLVGDQAAICLDYGQVTPAMLNVHAADIWQMEAGVGANHSLTNSVSPDVYEGALMYLAGMSYYEKNDQFDQYNQNLQKFDELSSFAAGLSKIIPGRDSYGNLTNGTDPTLPCVDMFFYGTMLVGNGTVQPDSSTSYTMAEENYELVGIADGSAEEHAVINRFYQQTNAVSTVRLLQLAQSKGGGIVPLTPYNYLSKGTTSYQGTNLESWDPNMWQQVVSAFQGTYGQYVTAYMTPGPMTNATYRGMGALILTPYVYSALISPASINGGFAGQTLPPDTIAAANTINYQVAVNNDDYEADLTAPTGTGSQMFDDNTANLTDPTAANQLVQGNDVVNQVDTTIAVNEAQVGGLNTGTSSANIAADVLNSDQAGDQGAPTDQGSQQNTVVGDPVNNVTGEFYVDETDLKLPGPMPLALRRNYSSQTLADNQFGYGWKLSIMPYLSLSKNSTNIYAADMDGSVLAYVHSTSNTNMWMPTLAANPRLNNNTTAGVGGLVNRLRDYIIRSTTNSGSGTITNYTLYGADGSVRAFQFMKFNSGTITNARPYLTQWTDNRGNYYTFAYDTNANDANFGQMQRIQCSNGNYLCFDYDIYGHMIDAYSGDGRWMYYDYDDYGDLVTVTLPDNTTRSYQYLHSTQAVTNSGVVTQQPYSTHLIIEEDKPDGRELINAYDSQRRVTNQLSTAGSDLNPIRTATFVYSNNFAITNSFTNTISGFTFVIDGLSHTNRYDYTNDLITKITDPLGQTIQQVWYPNTTNAPGYPRSVMLSVDKRGLTNFFQYDGNGNVTNCVTTGDVTGDGITTQTCTNTAIYNTNSLPVQATDPAGNSTLVIYDPVFAFLPQQTIRYVGATPVTTNYTFYGNATNVVVNGSLTLTNLAFGLPVRQIRAFGSPDAASNDMAYNGNGFLTQTIRYTGTGDPNVTNTFFYNERGQMVDKVDALGAVTFFDYDAMNRPIEQENFDEFGNALAWNFIYYTDNGEVSWIDGPRYNPEDYIFYDYDGAGRRSTEIHWRSEANAAGTGVEASAGYNLYAQSFYQYDVLGNLTLAVDPRGAMITNKWDALCRLVQRQHLDTDGATVLSTETFGYEPGGQVQFYTNSLGGVTTTLYTDTGKPEFRSNADGSTNAWRYYLDGRINKEVQGNGAFWQTTYDDVNRITTRTFYSMTGVPLATNLTQVDRRGNVIKKADASGDVFPSQYDALDRSKVVAGPAIVTVSSYEDVNFNVHYTTNTLQQASTNFYDAAGRVLTNVNTLGESMVTIMDALGRTTGTQVRNNSGSLVREQYISYSADHNSITVTNGSGTNAIGQTTWTDTEGHTVLSIGYPSANNIEFVLNQYDLAGNLVSAQHDSSTSGTVTPWTTASFVHDGLNRTTAKYDCDNALTTYAFDAMGDLTNCTLPGGLQMQATYNNAGQKLQEQNFGSGNITRTTTYSYYSSGTSFAGMLQTKTDGRGVACAFSYDDWLRPTNLSFSGSLPEQDVTTALRYEIRGYVTNITEQFSTTNTGPTTTVIRSYDAYGQLASESVNGGAVSYGTSQNWDATGRRTQLNMSGNSYGFSWQADGGLTAVSDTTGSGSYTYTTAGLLTSRTVGNRQTTLSSFDGEGRPLSIATTVNLLPALTESLAWSADGLLSAHTLNRANDFTDSRLYAYANVTRRLTQEQLNLNSSTTWTNTFAYDNGNGQGPGVLTSSGNGPASWTGGTDAFSRINTATNTLIPYTAYGHVNGQSTLSAWLDNQPVSVTGVGTNAMQWQASVELAQGQHQLLVAALHPSGLFTAWATNSFTNSLAKESVNDSFDGAGNITSRVWLNPSGAVERTQSLSWDAHGLLHAVTERDANTNGYNWTAVYDGLGRRLSTTSILVSNGVAFTSTPITINSCFDPQVEFLELGVSYGNTTEWKLYGPDLNGVYGGANGTGGFEAVSPYLTLFEPTISDVRGNILGVVTNGAVQWNPARPTGYGAVPGYRPVALGSGIGISLSSAWRGRWADSTSYIQVGARTYDPVSGRWLSFDPAWNGSDVNGMSFAGGDPINAFDADGRMSRLDYEIQDLPNEVDALWDQFADPNLNNGYFVKNLFTYSSEARNVLGAFFPGQSYDDLNFAQKLFAISLMSGEYSGQAAPPSFTDASANANFYNQMAANGMNQGGVGGYAEAAVGQIGEDLLDLFGTTGVQQSAEQSGYASADPSRQGAAWGYGALTVGTIAMNAIPGEGKAATLVEEEGERVVAAKTTETTTENVVGTEVAQSANGDFYSVAYQMQLDAADLGKSRSVHFNRANASLDAAMAADPEFAAMMEDLIPGVGDSVSRVGGRETPEGWVWHHDQDTGIMQLVPEAQHTPGSIFWDTLHPGGRGGYSIWAIPAGAPAN